MLDMHTLSTRQMCRWSCWSKHLAGVCRLWEKWESDSRLGKDSIQVRQWQSIGRRRVCMSKRLGKNTVFEEET